MEITVSVKTESDLSTNHSFYSSIFCLQRYLVPLNFESLMGSTVQICLLVHFSHCQLISICISANSITTHAFAFQLPKFFSCHHLPHSFYPSSLCLCSKNPFAVIFSQVSQVNGYSCMYSIYYLSHLTVWFIIVIN